MSEPTKEEIEAAFREYFDRVWDHPSSCTCGDCLQCDAYKDTAEIYGIDTHAIIANKVK